jgi:ABC-type Fe3+-siderophore transport system permease subunit
MRPALAVGDTRRGCGQRHPAVLRIAKIDDFADDAPAVRLHAAAGGDLPRTRTRTEPLLMDEPFSMGTPWQIFWRIRMPNALHFIFGGMKISITLAIIGVIVSEFVASQEGIGYLSKLSSGRLDTPLMIAAITALSLAGLYAIIAEVEKRMVYWQPPTAVGGGA